LSEEASKVVLSTCKLKTIERLVKYRHSENS
jgi:hypothetical protein